MKKKFMLVGKLEMTFKGGKSVRVVGRDVVPTGVEVEFDEHGKDNSKVEIEQYELEHGLMSRTEIVMPPLVSYDFKDIFAARGERAAPRR